MQNRLIDAFYIDSGIIAVIGGGGKTSLCLELCREAKDAGKKAIYTTTAKMYPPENMPICSDYESVKAALCENSIVCAGILSPACKMLAICLNLAIFRDLCDIIVVEADGSRGLPIKAHAAHEPPVPDGADRVIYVVGADGLCESIQRAVHRPELYTAQTKQTADDIVLPEKEAERIGSNFAYPSVYVNKAETDGNLMRAHRFARAYDGCCVIGSLRCDPVKEIWRNGICLHS